MNWHAEHQDFRIVIAKVIHVSPLPLLHYPLLHYVRGGDDAVRLKRGARTESEDGVYYFECCVGVEFASDSLHVFDPSGLLDRATLSLPSSELVSMTSGKPGLSIELFDSDFDNDLPDLETQSYPVRCCNLHARRLIVDPKYAKTKQHTLFHGKVKRVCPVRGCDVAWWGGEKSLPASAEVRNARRLLFEKMERMPKSELQSFYSSLVGRFGMETVLIGTMNLAECRQFSLWIDGDRTGLEPQAAKSIPRQASQAIQIVSASRRRMTLEE